MNEKLQTELLKILHKANEQLELKNYAGAKEILQLMEEKIKTPLPGEGTNGH